MGPTKLCEIDSPVLKGEENEQKVSTDVSLE